jgi:hypothetical protein
MRGDTSSVGLYHCGDEVDVDDSARVIKSSRTRFKCSSLSGCSGSFMSGEESAYISSIDDLSAAGSASEQKRRNSSLCRSRHNEPLCWLSILLSVALIEMAQEVESS